jgi:hypothetical protein
MKTNNSFTIPRLCSCREDITKQWYVFFHYEDDIYHVRYIGNSQVYTINTFASLMAL